MQRATAVVAVSLLPLVSIDAEIVSPTLAADQSTAVVAAIDAADPELRGAFRNSEHENYDESIRCFAAAAGVSDAKRIGVPPLLRTASSRLH